MPAHDWTLVPAGTFHDFHGAWIIHIKEALNGGLLPEGYYSQYEQHAGRTIADVLTLHASTPPPEPMPLPPATGGTILAEAPPKVRRKQSIDTSALRRRSLAIRHISGHRLIALLEIVSPANKDRPRSIDGFTDKVEAMLRVGVHMVLVDLFPPGPHDPQGMHGAIQQRLNRFEMPYDLPAEEPLTLASYIAGASVDVYLEHLAVGSALPDMPLFLRPDRYINLPLEATYQQAYRGMPAFWRDVLEGRTSNPTD